MPSNPIVRTIARAQAQDGPHVQGVYLQMDGTGVNGHSPTGHGRLRAGHGAGVFDQFKMSPRPTDGSAHLTTFESVAHPNVYLRMDGSGVTQATSLGGGIVNMSWGKGQNEEFWVRYNANGTVSFESKAFPGAFLRLSMGEIPGETGISVNCQYGSAGEFEQFRLEEPPATPRLRLLTYHLHLM
jgi:phospholipase C